VDVRVKRGEVTLPIGEIPNLLAGDRLWIHPDLPESQSAHYVLIVAFLRGTTNPPPPEWFYPGGNVDAGGARRGGVRHRPRGGPAGADLSCAGDGRRLQHPAQGRDQRPGAFVRAVQDLQAASWDRMRLNAFLAEVKVTSQTDPKSLKGRTEMAARKPGHPARTAVLRQAQRSARLLAWCSTPMDW